MVDNHKIENSFLFVKNGKRFPIEKNKKHDIFKENLLIVFNCIYLFS